MNQELRYNLATKVMRNGVEVIVATDRNLRPLEAEYLRHLSSTVTRPITLAPHTLTNLMSMVLPTEYAADGQSHLLSILQPSFVTRTYYTTYNYPETILKGNTTAVSNLQTVITNVVTEEHSKRKIQPTATQSVTLNSSPTLLTEVFHTIYTYWNTFTDGEQPIVVSSTQALSNTLVGSFAGNSDLEPSEVYPTTNTYLKTIEFTKTLTDGTDFQIISTKELMTQVVVTDKPIKKATNVPITTDVTKTYFVTYTYFSTYLDGDKTKVKSDVSVSSDVTIEKFYIKPKKTETRIVEQTMKQEVPVKSLTLPFSILATRTYLTTFTYFTTLLQGPNTDKAETKINSRTKVVENTITQTISLQDFNADYLVRLNNSLNKVTGSLVATATLKGGEKIRITAHRNPGLSSSYLKYEIKPTKTVISAETKTETYQVDKKEPEPVKTKSTHSKSSPPMSKTKSTHKSKVKTTKTTIREATAEALVATEGEINSISATPTVTLTPASSAFVKEVSAGNSAPPTISPAVTQPPQEATVLSGEEAMKDQTAQPSEVPDLIKKKPILKQTIAPVNVSNLLNLNSLGINGMNVLGPVFNAMAELIHNNLNKNADTLTRRNDTIPPAKETEQVSKKPLSTNINPLLSFVNKFTPATAKGTAEPKAKVTTPRTPVYIPVGSFAKDSEFGESQDVSVAVNRPENWHEKWTDTHAKNFEKGRPHDPPITILEGGIPISPGQVITTNSDVIIGRPGETGPRPPKFAVKNNVPVDMKPPPLPQHLAFGGEDEDGFLGQHSTNQGINFGVNEEEHVVSPPRPPPLPPKKHPLDPHKNLRPHPNDRYKGPPHKNPHTGKHHHADYDSGTLDLNPPPMPPPPVRSHDVHRPITINHDQEDKPEPYKTPNHILPIPVHLGPNQNVENYINPADISPPVLGIPNVAQFHQENVHHILHEPTPGMNAVNPNGIVLIPTVAHLPVNLGPTENSHGVDRSTGHQLLVNIQPSQVANIVIPHGSSTALILSDGKQHSLKGEVIDDPSPHPEPETVGFVGAEPVLKIENEDLSGSLHNNVIPAAAGELPQQTSKDNRVLFSNRPHLTTELIKIRPKPSFNDPKGHSVPVQNAQHLFLGQHQSLNSRPVDPYIDNHRQAENNHKLENVHANAHFGSQTVVKGPGGIHINQNQASEANKIYQNYRKEGANFFSHVPNPQSIPPQVIQTQHKHHGYLPNTGGQYADQNKHVQTSNPVRAGNGIYVDISPPGHLPPRPNANHLHQSHSPDKQQSTINEHLLNHQSGLVHDVPLNAQVQLGTGQKKENPLKEILISANTNKHDSIYDPKKKPAEGMFPENLKRPLPELPENLSPPPLIKEGNYRIHRPPIKPPVTAVQRYPPYPHQPIPKPFDFMIPPPQISHRPNQKPHPEPTRPHPEHHPRPIIPIGAGAQQNYPNPRPEDIVIVPHKNRPGTSIFNYVNNVNHDVQQQNLGISSDLDVGGSNEPLKTEFGEEIQESISRPLFPGQLPVELQKLNASGHLQTHKGSDVSKNKQDLETNGTAIKPEVGSHKDKSEDLTNVSTQWPSGYKQNPVYGTDQASVTNSQGSFFSFIKKPSGFVTTNNSGTATNHKESFSNHKKSPPPANHQEQTRPSTGVKGAGSAGGGKIRIHAVGPSVLPSGFVKNENAVHKKPASVAVIPGAVEPPRQPPTGSVFTNQNGHTTKESQGATANNKPPSKDVSVFGLKNKVQSTTVQGEQPGDKLHGTRKVPTRPPGVPILGQNKPPGRPHSNGYSEDESSGSKQKVQPGQKNKPTGVQEPDGGTGAIKFESNKVSNGHVSAPGIYNKPHSYPITNLASTQSVKTNKRPSGFTTKKEEKVPGSLGVADNDPPLPAQEPPQKEPAVPVKVPSGFTTKNETDHSFAAISNHNYGNKTIHFYESKPSFDENGDRDVTYNKGEGNVDKWFAANFGSQNGNADLNGRPANKLSPGLTQRNVSSLPNADDSDVRITLLTPPKAADARPKPDEVMGLSPPPLERPRRPAQTGHRPKPPFKFEIPTTPKSTLPPIPIENDFPPVRSPEFNRKPLKPQDIFPPRLPDNFIHHIPELPVRNHPKPRPVTSMPIDIPNESTTEKNVYPGELEENGGRDTFFAGSEINGHSKPIIDTEPILTSMRPPPPPPPPNRPKPPVQPKPSTIYQQPPKLRTSERIKPETTSTATSVRKEISPTPTISPPAKTTFHTKVSASVTPTAVQTQKDWGSSDIITGSETIFDPDKFSSYLTPTIQDFTSKKKIVTTLIKTGSTTIFGDLYTSGPKRVTPTTSSTTTEAAKSEETVARPTKTTVPVHTTTLTVTTTMTTVVHSVGHKPFTKTIVLTKTLISTVVNKVTETKTLVKPTTEIVTQTHTIATTKTALVVPTALYPTPTKYPPGGTLKPEIFVADPHAKDTMTISVSSSLNKHAHGEEKRKLPGARPDPEGKDSILVFNDPDLNDEGNSIEEENDVDESRVVVGGVFDASSEKEYKEGSKDVECSPGCKSKRNELCQRIEGVMKCVCRPGFARMFPDRPCRPTYTYKVQLALEKFGSEQITHDKNFGQSTSPNMAKLASATKEGLDRMIMQSDLRDTYHGIMVNGFQGKGKKTTVDFYVQLSENTDEAKLTEILKKTLQTSNYSLGGTELFAAREAGSLYAEDFNECLNPKFHDCSENARCFNLKGTYTCSCKEGFTDVSENSQFPGRLCSDAIGCEYCGYHGACYSKGEGQITCECFQWYSGERCHINLKVLLIALVTIGAILLALLSVCAVMTCLNRRSRGSTSSRTNGYLRYRGPSNRSLDRRAMIGDSSSESSVDNLPYICSPTLPSSEVKKKPVLRHVKGPAPRPVPPPGMERDRSVTVMIPRAKYRPMPPLSPHLTMSTFSPDKHLSKTAAQIATEAKLISYLDGNSREDRAIASTIQNNRQGKEQQKSEYKTPSPKAGGSPKTPEKKKESKVFEYEYKISNMLFTEETNSTDKRSFRSLDDRFRRHSDSTHLNSDLSNRNQFRKYSAGALVSAGYEVSAKVGMHHLEEDTTEDERSVIINSHTMKSNHSQFTTLNRTGDHKTMSEARSYDETTVHPPTRSLKTHYSGSSPSSRVNNDEGHTMIERDLGSTFIMPESQLFKPEADRGSDISNFDSL